MLRLFRLTRNFFLLLIVVALAGMGACFVSAGRMVVDPQAMQTPPAADVIFVLSGSMADRWLEGVDLWRERRAPLVVLSPGNIDGAVLELRRRGLHLPTGSESAREVMIHQLGMPERAVEIMPGVVDNTAAEAEGFRRMAIARGWRSVIVVTSLPHTRRSLLAMRRTLQDAGVVVHVRASRYDTFNPRGWWRDRNSVRWIMTELPKLVAYRLGLGE